ncbi:hypothetical protein ACROYT_G020483 [Oculina patagonica]
MKWLYVLVLCGVALADHDENDVNKDLNLFDGDIKLTGEQRLALALGLDVDNPFGRASHRGRQWPGGVMCVVVELGGPSNKEWRSGRGKLAFASGKGEGKQRLHISYLAEGVHHLWEEADAVKISLLPRDVGPGELQLMKSVRAKADKIKCE